MDKIQILVLANHPEILATMLRLINKNELWNGIGAVSAGEATEAFTLNKIDLVLLGVGVDAETEQQLLQTFRSARPPHYLCQAFWRRKRIALF